MKNLVILSALLFSATASRAQVTYLADAQTGPTSADVRLYMDLAETTPAPIGTKLWFVADLSGNGIPSGQVTTAQIQDIVNGTGDDRLFFTDAVDGTLIGSQPGKYRHPGIEVPNSYQTASIGVLLWSDTGGNGTVGDAGDTFGYYNFGVVPPPLPGNALYVIAGDVHADQNLVVVPEPAQLGVAFGLVCLAGALVRRTGQKLAPV